VWTQEAEKAFVDIKAAVAAYKPLARPDFGKEFCLQTDASNIGIAAVLFQFDNKSNKKISNLLQV